MEQNVTKTRKGSLRHAAKREKVSHTTIRRCELFKRSIDVICEHIGNDAKQTILSGDVKISRNAVDWLADIALYDADAARKLFAELPNYPIMKTRSRRVAEVYIAIYEQILKAEITVSR